MERHLCGTLVTVAAGLMAVSACAANAQPATRPATTATGDWPGFRGGLDRSAVSSETGLARTWPAGGPPLLWRFDGLGQGFSGLSVKGNQVVTVGAAGMTCLDLATGKRLWLVPGVRSAECTPQIEGDRIYHKSGLTVACHSLADGKPLWSRDPKRDLAALGEWKDRTCYSSTAASPLVGLGRVYVTTGHTKAVVTALDAATGEILWRTVGPEVTDGRGWGSPILVRHGGRDLLLTPTIRHLLGVDPSSGQMLWNVELAEEVKPGTFGIGNVPVYRDGLVHIAAAYGPQVSKALRLSADGGSVSEVWSRTLIAPFQESATLAGGMLFGMGRLMWSDADADPNLLVDGKPLAEAKVRLHARRAGRDKEGLRLLEKPGQGFGLVCQDLATGKVLGIRFDLSEKSPGFAGPMVIAADGMLIVMWSWERPRLYLVKADPAMEVLGQLTPPTPEETPKGVWRGFTIPTLAGGRLLVRDMGTVFCYDLRAQSSSAASGKERER
jgi:outer membrane protein assembly factor BamB